MQSFDVDFNKQPFLIPPFAVEARNEDARLAAGDDYAMVKSGPDVASEEVELAGTTACEVMICWGTQVLHVAHFAQPHVSKPKSFVIGEARADGKTPDFLVPSQKLGTLELPLCTLDAMGLSLVIPPTATGRIDTAEGEALTLDEVRARARVSSALADGHEFTLLHGAKAALTLNGFTFRIAAVHAGKPAKRGLLASFERGVAGYFGGTFLAFGATMAALAFLVPDMTLLDQEELARDRMYMIQQILKTDAEVERDETETAEDSDQDSSDGGTGERATGEESAIGSPTSQATGKHYGIQGPEDNSDPRLARRNAIEEAQTFGMLNILSGTLDVPTAPWADDRALGRDRENALGNMWGDALGESFGGGLGLTGIGEGGGGNGFGVGLGNDGVGQGAGLGLGQGIGNGIGKSFGRLTANRKSDGAPRMRPGVTTVSGRLPPEVIQRTVRQNYGRFRMCYEQGLVKNPNLEGRVATRFVIGRGGTVENAQNGGSDLPDSGVVGCVVSAFYGLSFPEPQGGIVTVTYPIVFSAG